LKQLVPAAEGPAHSASGRGALQPASAISPASFVQTTHKPVWQPRCGRLVRPVGAESHLSGTRRCARGTTSKAATLPASAVGLALSLKARTQRRSGPGPQSCHAVRAAAARTRRQVHCTPHHRRLAPSPATLLRGVQPRSLPRHREAAPDVGAGSAFLAGLASSRSARCSEQNSCSSAKVAPHFRVGALTSRPRIRSFVTAVFMHALYVCIFTLHASFSCSPFSLSISRGAQLAAASQRRACGESRRNQRVATVPGYTKNATNVALSQQLACCAALKKHHHCAGPLEQAKCVLTAQQPLGTTASFAACTTSQEDNVP